MNTKAPLVQQYRAEVAAAGEQPDPTLLQFFTDVDALHDLPLPPSLETAPRWKELVGGPADQPPQHLLEWLRFQVRDLWWERPRIIWTPFQVARLIATVMILGFVLSLLPGLVPASGPASAPVAAWQRDPQLAHYAQTSLDIITTAITPTQRLASPPHIYRVGYISLVRTRELLSDESVLFGDPNRPLIVALATGGPLGWSPSMKKAPDGQIYPYLIFIYDYTNPQPIPLSREITISDAELQQFLAAVEDTAPWTIPVVSPAATP